MSKPAADILRALAARFRSLADWATADSGASDAHRAAASAKADIYDTIASELRETAAYLEAKCP